jgi:hypothetical protein
LALQSHKEPAKVESIFIIDMMFTTMQSYCQLSGGERKKKYNEHHRDVKKALDVQPDAAYLLPSIANLAIAVQLYNNEHNEPMLIFGATSEMYKAFQCKGFAASKIRPPHEYDELITFIFRHVPKVDITAEVPSDLFWKIALVIRLTKKLQR